MQSRVVHLSAPLASDLGCLFVATGGRRREAEFLGKAGGDLLMRIEPPVLLNRAHPLSALRMLTVINLEFYLSELAA